MNAWVLSMIICSAVPAQDGSYCRVHPLLYGVSQKVCRSELERWSRHPTRPRLECTNDPALTAELVERNGEPPHRLPPPNEASRPTL